MISRWLVVPLLALVRAVEGQRGDWGRGGWGGADFEQQPTTTVQQVVTQTQMETRTLVSTAPAQAPTTVLQATTVVRVSTVLAPPSSSPSLAQAQASSEGLTVDASISPSPATDTEAIPIASSSSASTQAASASSDPAQARLANDSASQLVDQNTTGPAASTVTVRTASLPVMSGGGVVMRTTGVPNMPDSANDVVYGHIASNDGHSQLLPAPISLTLVVLLVFLL